MNGAKWLRRGYFAPFTRNGELFSARGRRSAGHHLFPRDLPYLRKTAGGCEPRAPICADCLAWFTRVPQEPARFAVGHWSRSIPVVSERQRCPHCNPPTYAHSRVRVAWPSIENHL